MSDHSWDYIISSAIVRWPTVICSPVANLEEEVTCRRRANMEDIEQAADRGQWASEKEEVDVAGSCSQKWSMMQTHAVYEIRTNNKL